MRIPQVNYERERGELQMLLMDGKFNPVLHESPEALKESSRVLKECKCDSTNPDDFYPRNKSKCKYCVSRRVNAIQKGDIKVQAKIRPYAVCRCGVKGEENFYFAYDRGEKKLKYPCKKCKLKQYKSKQ